MEVSDLEYIVPWKVTFAKFNMKHLINIDALKDEVFNLSNLTDNEDPSQSFISADFMPTIIKLRNEIITPRVIQYAKEIFDWDMVKFDVDTNAKWIPEGEGLYPHYHPGSIISAIVYPTDSVSGINMFDPRVNACRGYPRSMRTKEFGTKSYSPKEGDVYIFPSYVQHSVSYVKEDVRLSMLHEYYNRNDL